MNQLKNRVGDFIPGDICWQFAQIVQPLPDEEIPENKVKLLVSDQHGLFKDTILFPKQLFKEQFAKDGDRPNIYFRWVKIESIEDGDKTIFYHRLNAKGEQCGSTQIARKDIFETTYFIPQHQMGDV